jgi:chromosome partitioning protein
MRTTVMEGQFGEFDLASVMQVVSIGRQYTGIDLFDESGRVVGTLFLKSGKVLSANTGSVSGLDAVTSLLRNNRSKRFTVYRAEPFADVASPVGSVAEIILRLMESEPPSGNRTTVMEGDFVEFDLLSVLQVISIGRQFAAVEVTDPRGRSLGTIKLKAGKVISATSDQLAGVDAIRRLARCPRESRFVVYRSRDAVAEHHLGPLAQILMKLADPDDQWDLAEPNTRARANAAPARPASPPAKPPTPSSSERPQASRSSPPPSPSRPPPLPAAARPPSHWPAAVPPPPPVAVPPPAPVPSFAPAPAPAPDRALSPAVAALAPPMGTPEAAPTRSRLETRSLKIDVKSERVDDRAGATFLEPPTHPGAIGAVAQGAATVPIIAVTSPKGGTGKTTVSLNLGVALARQGKRVVLFDADGNGVLLALNAVGKGGAGVYDVMAGKAQLAHVAMKTRIAGLRIVPSGDPSWSASATSDAWAKVFAHARSEADVVLVDTAAGLFGASGEVCAAASHALVVLSAEPTSIRALPIHLQRLGTLGHSPPHVVGVVLNMLDYRTPVSLDVLRELCSGPSAAWVFDIPIARSGAFVDAVARGVPVCRGDRAGTPTIGWVFEMLASSILERLGLLTTTFDETILE